MQTKTRPPTQAELDRERVFASLIVCKTAPPDFNANDYWDAYKQGYFVMEAAHGPMIMCSQIREILPISHDVPRRIQRDIDKGNFSISTNLRFEDVLQNCAAIRKNLTYKGEVYTEDDQWIRQKTIGFLRGLHLARKAHSLEAWKDGKLVGGSLVLQVGAVAVSLSTYHAVSDAGKALLVGLRHILADNGFEVHDGVTPFNLGRDFGSHLEELSFELPRRLKAIQKKVTFPKLPVKLFKEHFPETLEHTRNQEHGRTLPRQECDASESQVGGQAVEDIRQTRPRNHGRGQKRLTGPGS
jgi:leucyl/phenylalanyl-tRNA--protein transferase